MQTLQHINYIVKRWPSKSRKVARDMIEKYGLPHEATESRLIWRYNGPWKETVLHSEGVRHNFPRPHVDILEQTIDYRVPEDRYADVMGFGGSIVIDRTRGEIKAHCDSEERNLMMLNQVHEICIGKRTPQEARSTVAEQAAIIRLGWPKPAMETLEVSSIPDTDRQGTTQDPDERASVVYHR